MPTTGAFFPPGRQWMCTGLAGTHLKGGSAWFLPPPRAQSQSWKPQDNAVEPAGRTRSRQSSFAPNLCFPSQDLRRPINMGPQGRAGEVEVWRAGRLLLLHQGGLGGGKKTQRSKVTSWERGAAEASIASLLRQPPNSPRCQSNKL